MHPKNLAAALALFSSVAGAGARDYVIPYEVDDDGIALVSSAAPHDTRVLVPDGVERTDGTLPRVLSTGFLEGRGLEDVRPHTLLFFHDFAFKRVSLRAGLEPTVKTIIQPDGHVCRSAVIQRDLNDPLDTVLIFEGRYRFDDPSVCFTGSLPDFQSIRAVNLFAGASQVPTVLAYGAPSGPSDPAENALGTVIALHDKSGLLTAAFIQVGDEIRRYSPDLQSFDVIADHVQDFARLARVQDGGAIVLLDNAIRRIGVQGRVYPALFKVPVGYQLLNAFLGEKDLYVSVVSADASESIKTRIHVIDIDGANAPGILVELSQYGRVRGITDSRVLYSTGTKDFGFAGRLSLLSIPRVPGGEPVIVAHASAEEMLAVFPAQNRAFITLRARDSSSSRAIVSTDTGTVLRRFGEGSSWMGAVYADRSPYPLLQNRPVQVLLAREGTAASGGLAGPIVERLDTVTLEKTRITDLPDDTITGTSLGIGGALGYGRVGLHLCRVDDVQPNVLCLLDTVADEWVQVAAPVETTPTGTIAPMFDQP